MVSPTSDVFSSTRPAPLAWKEFRRRSGLSPQPKVYVYDASPQIVPQSPPISTLSLSPVLSSSCGLDSPRKDHSGLLVSHVSQALQALGASTGGNIAEYIANNFTTELGAPYERGRKLHYMVNAILSSPKYKYLFLKDQVLKDEKRSLWRLKQPGEPVEEDSNMPLGISLSSLIPSSPALSLRLSSDIVELPTPSPLSAPSTPSLRTSGNLVINISSIIQPKIVSSTPTPSAHSLPSPQPVREGYGGSNEGHNGEKHMGVLLRTTEHPPNVPSIPPAFLPSPTSPISPDPCSPPLSDTPSMLALSSRRKKRKGLDSSLGIEAGSPKQYDEQQGGAEEKKRRLDVAA